MSLIQHTNDVFKQETVVKPHGNLPAPENTRPYRAAYEEGMEIIIVNGYRRDVYRQIGWHGHSGAFYSLDEDPMKHEPAGFSPIWVCAHSDRIDPPEDKA